MTDKAQIKTSERAHAFEKGKCSMCEAGDIPNGGMHGPHVCRNGEGCFFCTNAGMREGDQCQCCGRILKAGGE